MEQINLNARKRVKGTRGQANRLRRSGIVPAIYYGAGLESLPLEVDAKELKAIYRRHEDKHILNLQIPDAQGDAKAIIRDVQKDVLTGDIIHIDFQHISMDTKIAVEVPVEFTGESVGVKTNGGFMQIVMRTLKIECLPGDIPEKISVDVSALDIGQSIHIGAISLPKIAFLHNADDVVVTITTIREEVAAPVAAVAETAAEPELAKTKGKKEEEGAEGAASGKEKGKEKGSEKK